MTFAALQSRVNAAVAATLLTDAATLNSVAITGKFDNGYAASFGMDGTQPSFTCLSADASTAVRGTAFVHSAINYTVQGIEPDGAGMTRLVLEKV